MFERRQRLLLSGASVAYPHMLYQRVSEQDAGREEGIAILSRFPFVEHGVCVLLPSAAAAKPRQTDAPPLHWLSSDSDRRVPPDVPDNARVVLYARLRVLDDATAPGALVDVFATHWPVSDVEQCSAAAQMLAFMNLVWQRGARRVPQIALGDFNAYFDFEWPVDLLSGKVLGDATLNKCWPQWERASLGTVFAYT